MAHNARLIARVAGAPVVAVVKAEAYGHGALPVARTLAPLAEIRGFAVNLIEEAMALRDGGIDGFLLVMGPSLGGGYDEVVARSLTPMVSSFEDLAGLDQAARGRSQRLPIHLYIDTGMGRLGFVQDDMERLTESLARFDMLRTTGICTHFACADMDDPDDRACMTRRQMARFADVRARIARALDNAGVGAVAVKDRLVYHQANSAAALRFAEIGGDFVRAGLALYGNGPGPRLGVSTGTPSGPSDATSGDSASATLRPVMHLRTRVAQIRTIATGESVSYGALFCADRTTSVAVLPLGYADGVPRRVTGRAEVLIRGRRCPTVGAITMGMIMVDVTDMPEPVQVGDPVVVFGEGDGARISVAEFADWAGCIEYEVTCGITRRVPRVYRSAAGGRS